MITNNSSIAIDEGMLNLVVGDKNVQTERLGYLASGETVFGAFHNCSSAGDFRLTLSDARGEIFRSHFGYISNDVDTKNIFTIKGVRSPISVKYESLKLLTPTQK